MELVMCDICGVESRENLCPKCTEVVTHFNKHHSEITNYLNGVKEEWRPIPDFPGYEASNNGRIRSVPREVVRSDGRQVTRRGTILRPSGAKRSGLMVVLSVAGKVRTLNASRLIMTAFPDMQRDDAVGKVEQWYIGSREVNQRLAY